MRDRLVQRKYTGVGEGGGGSCRDKGMFFRCGTCTYCKYMEVGKLILSLMGKVLKLHIWEF